jgi:hypothetical protein
VCVFNLAEAEEARRWIGVAFAPGTAGRQALI